MPPHLPLDGQLGEWFDHPTAGPLLMKVVGGYIGDDTESEMYRMAAQMPVGTLLTMFGSAIPSDLVETIRAAAR